MGQEIQQLRKSIFDELTKIVDPEIGVSIMELELIDKVDIEDGKVSFAYKDYKHGSVKKEMTLSGMEFIRRFSLHILPKGFVRIRHYGICSSSAKVKSALVIKAQLPLQMAKPFDAITKAAPVPYNPKQCPCCKKETLPF